jgi:hypothetical protein
MRNWIESKTLIKKIKLMNRERKIKRHAIRNAKKYSKEMKQFKEKYPKCIIFDDIKREDKNRERGGTVRGFILAIDKII